MLLQPALQLLARFTTTRPTTSEWPSGKWCLGASCCCWWSMMAYQAGGGIHRCAPCRRTAAAARPPALLLVTTAGCLTFSPPHHSTRLPRRLHRVCAGGAQALHDGYAAKESLLDVPCGPAAIAPAGGRSKPTGSSCAGAPALPAGPGPVSFCSSLPTARVRTPHERLRSGRGGVLAVFAVSHFVSSITRSRSWLSLRLALGRRSAPPPRHEVPVRHHPPVLRVQLHLRPLQLLRVQVQPELLQQRAHVLRLDAPRPGRVQLAERARQLRGGQRGGAQGSDAPRARLRVLSVRCGVGGGRPNRVLPVPPLRWAMRPQQLTDSAWRRGSAVPQDSVIWLRTSTEGIQEANAAGQVSCAPWACWWAC